MHDHIISIIDSIDVALSKAKTNDISLMRGRMGIAIFHANLFLFTGNPTAKDKYLSAMSFIIDRMGQIDMDHTLFGGATGVGWGIAFLRQKGLLPQYSDSLLDDIDQHIYRFGTQSLCVGNFDYLQGASGTVLYALRRGDNRHAIAFIESFVGQVDTWKQGKGHGFTWRSVSSAHDSVKPGHLYDLGIAHGTQSIIELLRQIHIRGFCRSDTTRLIHGALNWVIENKFVDRMLPSRYPAAVVDGPQRIVMPSSLAWYSGDLTMALLFLRCGRTFNNQSWIDESRAITEKAILRSDPLGNPCLGAYFFHGTSGIAYLLHKLFRKAVIPVVTSGLPFG